jgi:hypothetical protein
MFMISKIMIRTTTNIRRPERNAGEGRDELGGGEKLRSEINDLPLALL